MRKKELENIVEGLLQQIQALDEKNTRYLDKLNELNLELAATRRDRDRDRPIQGYNKDLRLIATLPERMRPERSTSVNLTSDGLLTIDTQGQIWWMKIHHKQ